MNKDRNSKKQQLDNSRKVEKKRRKTSLFVKSSIKVNLPYGTMRSFKNDEAALAASINIYVM